MALPQTLKALYHALITSLSSASIDCPELEARIILETRTNMGWSDVIARPDATIDVQMLRRIEHDIEARLTGKPLSRIYGEREFWGLPFKVTEYTLDPRPDTELIVELAVQRFSKREPEMILDLGTGTGCIVISLLHEFHKSQALGVDISSQALACALENAKRNDVADRFRVICGSWFEPIEKGTRFDLIVSNPPYIANQIIPTLSSDVQNHDPILALDGGADGLDPYKKIFSHLKNYLMPGGIGLLEIGYDQKDDILRLSESAGFALRTVHNDLAGNPRVVEISCGDK